MKQPNYSWSDRVFIHNFLWPVTLKVALNSTNNLFIGGLDNNYYLRSYIYGLSKMPSWNYRALANDQHMLHTILQKRQ